MLVLPLPVGSQASPNRGANPIQLPFAYDFGIPGSPKKSKPTGALVYLLVFCPARKAGREKWSPRPATSCSGSDGSHRMPTCTFSFLLSFTSSWKYSPRYFCRRPICAVLDCVRLLILPNRKSASASFVIDPLKPNVPLAD